VTATPGTGHTLLEKGKGHEPSPRDSWCRCHGPRSPPRIRAPSIVFPFPAPWRASPSGPVTWRGDHRGPRNGGPGGRGHADLDRDSHEGSTRLLRAAAACPFARRWDTDFTLAAWLPPGKSFAGRALRDGARMSPPAISLGGPVTTRCHAGPGWITEHGQGLPAPRPKAGFLSQGARTGRTPAAPNPRRESPSRPWKRPRGGPTTGKTRDTAMIVARVSKARQWDTQGALKGTARGYTNTGSSLATTPLVAARGQRWPVTREEGVPCRGGEPIATGTRSAGATPPAGRCTGR